MICLALLRSPFAPSMFGQLRCDHIGRARFFGFNCRTLFIVACAFRIDNLFIELSGPEIPIGDGSGLCVYGSIAVLAWSNKRAKNMPTSAAIFYGDGEKHAYVVPYNGLRLTCTIEFPHAKSANKKIDLDINEHSFARELSRARTFGF